MNVVNAAMKAEYERGRRDERAAIVSEARDYAEAIGSGPLMVDHLYASGVRDFLRRLEALNG